MLLPSPSSMRAAAITPAEPAGARVVRFPADGSLPRETGGSASALSVSRPARRSLALRPAWSLSRPRRPFLSKCFRRCRCLHHPLRLLPAGTTVSRAGFAPAGGWCLSTAHSLILIVAPHAAALEPAHRLRPGAGHQHRRDLGREHHLHRYRRAHRERDRGSIRTVTAPRRPLRVRALRRDIILVRASGSPFVR